ncbi:PREDICTED: G-type lectin S-receptor-like serine/threonine-protein kinase At1g11410 [Ipomoea nil]|uniref:G-type lectin S-receptor-like serine/threonine-protein kinase At1g11410 n=1 Tax=Ipomoea nil TaxID=35883 RepID=UPI0009009172|nr:PREDICTED: G-type lectin S-receptor-like serine/threonine-protein kinase At1g11410 [Ipomoea nil]
MGRQTEMSSTINLLFAVILSFLVSSLYGLTDTIAFNQTLKDGDLLISGEKSFVLGFFAPENSSGRRYVGIWYQRIPEQTVVWVANRDSPVNGTSGILFIDATGNLVIQDKKTNVSVWNTSLSSPVTGIKAYSAQLQDTGNLVLFRDRRSINWQSFDYPTNTLLPFMKFGVDKKTGLNRHLTSWKSPGDPGTGEYEFKMEVNGTPQVFLNRGPVRVWRTGPWSGVGWSGVPEMSRNYIFNLDYTENEDEVTMSYWIRDPSVHSIFVLNESGRVNRLTWQGDDVNKWVGFWSAPKDQCDAYAHCGAFSKCNTFNPGAFECTCLPGFRPNSSREWYLRDGVHGCRRNNTDVCHNREGFLLLSHMKVPDTKMARVNKTIGLKQCEELCLKNCSCTGYASANISAGGMGCITWYDDLIDIKEFTNGGQDIYIRVSASDLVKKSKGLRGKRLIVTMIVPIAAVILMLCCCLVMKIRKGKRLQSKTSLQSEWSSEMGKDVDDTAPADVLMYDLNTIRAATDNFSAANKLGEGGFGSVYKGKLQNEQLVAIKRLSKTSGQGMVEFKNEVTLIARLQHRNLVRLLGCCIQQGEKMLVYEYLPNKSLDSFIFENTSGISLDWKKRFEIILGIARGLLYLHQDSRLKIIHRDLKASNVLLDASMQPKISDFGMARIFGGDQMYANTNRVVGTYGYMSPEYAMEGHFSVKSDVFSFGVMLLEIVSGRKNKNQFNENSLNLIGDVWDFWSEEKALEIVDPSLAESYDGGEVLRCIHVGLLCVQAFPNDRPTMSEVVFMLSNETNLPHPNPPGFIFKHGNTAQCSSSMSAGNQSVNEVSITNMEGR